MPESLACFYREVGGNFDTLFLNTKPPALSFIYQSLGCFHSLQPSTNAFEPPSVPALLPNGFVRWQTIQILLDPDEHCQYLQNAVARWDIVNQDDGSTFPKAIPRDAFPAEPDSEMVQWHEEVSRRLEYDYWKRNTPRPSPGVRGRYCYMSPGDALPNEGYFSRSHYQTSPRRSRDRRSSVDYPSRRVQSDLYQRPQGHRPGFTSPRALSPPRAPGRSKSRRKAAFSLGTESEASEEDSGSSHRSGKRYGRRRNLGVYEPHARPHSHEAYTRKPRDKTPDYGRRYSHRDAYAQRYSKHHDPGHRPAYSPKRPADELPQRLNVKFNEFTFRDGGAASSTERDRRYSCSTASGHYARRGDPHDRRCSYSGSSGSSSERTRPVPAEPHRTPKWAEPTHSRRRVPVCVTEDTDTPPPKYDR